MKRQNITATTEGSQIDSRVARALLSDCAVNGFLREIESKDVFECFYIEYASFYKCR